MNNLTIVNTVLLAVLLIVTLTGIGWKGKEAAAPAPTPTPVPTAQPQPQPQPVAATSVSLDALKDFYKTTYIEGKKDAKISVIEFSDVQCPFCQRHTNAGTLDQVHAKYGDDINIVFAHFPLSIHPSAQKAGEALECAGKQGGEDVFFSFKKALFAKGGDPTLDVIQAVATEQKLNVTDLMACVNGGEFAAKMAGQTAFGRQLGVTGTPGNIVMNNETGEFQKVSGAVPATAFDAPIASYLAAK